MKVATKVNRNDSCPCGSGAKYKKCCEARDRSRSSTPSTATPSSFSFGLRTVAQQQQQQEAAQLQLAIQHHQAGNLPQAESIYRQILANNPRQADALHLLGALANQVGNNKVAVELINQAIAVAPKTGVFHNTLGKAFYEQGNAEAAIESWRRALRCDPQNAEAHNNLGTVLGVAEAVECFRTALRLKPDYAEAHNNLGAALLEQDDEESAIACYQNALLLKPDYLEAHYNLGKVYRQQGKLTAAVECYQTALGINPHHAETYNNLGIALGEMDDTEAAAACYRNAIKLDLESVEAHFNLGGIYISRDRFPEAVECFQSALRLKPKIPDLYLGLAMALKNQGYLQAGLENYQKALELKADTRTKIRMALALPIIAESREHMLESRERFDKSIADLLNEDISIKDPEKEVGETQFYLAYQGFNDLALQKQIAQMYTKACPNLLYTAPHCLEHKPRAAHAKIKIGFLSKFFNRDHIVGKVMKGFISNLSREHFSVHLFTFGELSQTMKDALHHPEDTVTRLPLHLERARQQIAEQQLDIMYHTDIGMCSFTYFLAFSRLAPIQCTSGGHPVTSGIESIDYYISYKHDEPTNGPEHYSEQLVRLDNRPVFYPRSCMPQSLKSRAHFGLQDDDHIYLCPMTIMKFHPDFDEILAGILRADEKGRIVLVGDPKDYLYELLLARLRRVMPDCVDRIIFVPRQSAEDFLSLMIVSNCVLDTIHFGGGTTSFEAMAVGAPVVTLPGEFMRGRNTYSFYRQMDLLDCAAKDKEDYVRIAVRLGTDPSFREHMKTEILARCHVLFDDVEGVKELQQFLIEAVQKVGTGEAVAIG